MEWFAQLPHNIPYIDNSSVLTIGFIIQVFAVVGLTWKLAQVNTELQLRLHRIEYDVNNIAEKVRDNIINIERHKRTINDLICTKCISHENRDIEIDHV